MKKNNNIAAFFALLRAGLWEKEVRLAEYGKPDFRGIHRLAREQAVIGLVAAGLEHATDIQIDADDSVEIVQIRKLKGGDITFIVESELVIKPGAETIAEAGKKDHRPAHFPG